MPAYRVKWHDPYDGEVTYSTEQFVDPIAAREWANEILLGMGDDDSVFEVVQVKEAKHA